MLPYRPPQQRPVLAAPPPRRNLGAISSLDVGDWLMLFGGALVGGIGINAVVGQVQTKKFDAVGLLLDAVIIAVGGTVFVQKFGKLTY